jgi:ornithine cyclodeaminase/alanine dehydrogenase-like protein (mu-crystallin family)
MRILSAADVREAAGMRDVIEAVRSAYMEYSAGEAAVPLRVPIKTANGGTTLFMPGYSPKAEAMAVKVVSVFPSNLELGLPTISALVVLSDGSTGVPLAVMDGASITAIRTGAASGVGTDLMARPDASVAAVIGAGVQGRTQLQALAAVRALTEVRVFDADRARAEAFAAEMGELTGLPVRVAATGDEAVDGADIVACATTSRTPVFSGARLAPGAHVNGAGSYTPQMQEVDEETVLRAAKIAVDSREAVLAEAGDLLVPMGKGLIDAGAVYAEIGEIAAGARLGREAPEEITFFKHVGIALLDVVTAKLVYERARARNMGVDIDLQ